MSDVIELGSVADRDAWIADRGCACGGGWQIARVDPADDGIDHVAVGCEACGTEQTFRFRLSEPDPLAELRRFTRAFQGDREKPREHHYGFAHVLFPHLYFQDPGLWLESLGQPGGADRLRDVWDTMGNSLDPGQQPVPSAALDVTPTTVADRPAILIRLPEPERVAEVYLIALVGARGPDPARYLILELAEQLDAAVPAFGFLCEWFPDGSRCNHQVIGPPDADEFRRLVTEVVGRGGGDRPAGWKPGTEVPPGFPDAGLIPFGMLTGSRKWGFHRCRVAYVVLPVLLKKHARELAALHRGRADRDMLRQIWSATAEHCARFGEPVEPFPADLHLGLVGDREPELLVARFPPPRAAPEPYCLAVPVRVGRRGIWGRIGGLFRRPDRPVYSLEAADEPGGPPLVCRVGETGGHQPVGVLPSADEAAFVGLVRRLAAGGAGDPWPDESMERSTAYIQIEAPEIASMLYVGR